MILHNESLKIGDVKFISGWNCCMEPLAFRYLFECFLVRTDANTTDKDETT